MCIGSTPWRWVLATPARFGFVSSCCLPTPNEPPNACCERPTFARLAAALALVVVVHHGDQHTLLDVFHVVAERGSAALLAE